MNKGICPHCQHELDMTDATGAFGIANPEYIVAISHLLTDIAASTLEARLRSRFERSGWTYFWSGWAVCDAEGRMAGHWTAHRSIKRSSDTLGSTDQAIANKYGSAWFRRNYVCSETFSDDDADPEERKRLALKSLIDFIETEGHSRARTCYDPVLASS